MTIIIIIMTIIIIIIIIIIMIINNNNDDNDNNVQLKVCSAVGARARIIFSLKAAVMEVRLRRRQPD
jgi:ABC-type transport system involved in multi-copper enzyme maturation permease subunit